MRRQLNFTISVIFLIFKFVKILFASYYITTVIVILSVVVAFKCCFTIALSIISASSTLCNESSMQ